MWMLLSLSLSFIFHCFCTLSESGCALGVGVLSLVEQIIIKSQKQEEEEEEEEEEETQKGRERKETKKGFTHICMFFSLPLAHTHKEKEFLCLALSGKINVNTKQTQCCTKTRQNADLYSFDCERYRTKKNGVRKNNNNSPAEHSKRNRKNNNNTHPVAEQQNIQIPNRANNSENLPFKTEE